MKYTGINQEGFERDVHMLLDFYDRDERVTSMVNPFVEAVWDLADAFGIDRSDIWDYLPEYDD